MLEEIDALLFEPLRQMDLSQGIDFHMLEKTRVAYIKRLFSDDRRSAVAYGIIYDTDIIGKSSGSTASVRVPLTPELSCGAARA
jgi:hypothetical protein